MKSFLPLVALAAGTNALVSRTDGCCFHLTASGGASGPVGQLDDGQNRIGDNSLHPATFCIDSAGQIIDGSGRGCILTAPTTQLQCDDGATSTAGFSVSSSGQLAFEGDTSFIACETGQNGGMNIYTTNSSAVTQCKDIQLHADACSGAGASPVAPPPPASTVPPAQSSAGSAPPGSTPAPSAPASSAPLPGPPVTVVSTVTVSECSCPPTSAPGAPGSPAPAPAPGPSSAAPAPSGGAPAPSGSAPAPSGSVSATPGGAPAPSHSAPAPSGSAPVPTSSAPAPSGNVSVPKPSSSFTSIPVIPSSTSKLPSSSVSATPSGTSAAGACPTTLSSDVNGNFEFPHLIVPINSGSPNTAYGTQFNGTVSDSVSSIFNFDVSSSRAGQTCSLVFLFPQKADLETSSFTFSGNGKVDVAQLSHPASTSTTFHNAPSVMKNLGAITISPGSNTVISTFPCPAGQTVAYEMKNVGTTDLTFFEDYNPAPIGLFITVC